MKLIKTIYHYVSNLGMPGERPPCMQDGVAPQTNIPGLSARRVTIPSSENGHKGYGESHYHGFYTWVFDIAPAQLGYIKHR